MYRPWLPESEVLENDSRKAASEKSEKSVKRMYNESWVGNEKEKENLDLLYPADDRQGDPWQCPPFDFAMCGIALDDGNFAIGLF